MKINNYLIELLINFYKKITDFFKSNWNDYKYHSLMMDPYFSKPKTWEQILGLVIFVGLLYGSYYKLHLLVALSCGLLSIALGIQSYRGFKEFNQCYKGYIKPNILKGGSPFLILKRSGGTLTATAIKFGKPIIKACIYCVSGTLTVTAWYDYSFGFNPLREYVLVKTGAQTKEQAWNHILNPNKYANLDHPPYVEDLKQEILRRDQEILRRDQELEQLRKSVDQIIKKK